MSAIMYRLKVAMIRKPGPPIGQLGEVYLNCPCGAKPDTQLNVPDVWCQCGAKYSWDGHIKEYEGPVE